MNKNKPIKSMDWLGKELSKVLFELDQKQDKPLFTEPCKNSKQDNK